MNAFSLWKIIITAPFGIVYFLLLSNWRFSRTKTFLITGAGILAVIILDILLELRLPESISDLEFRLLHIVIAIGFNILLSRYNDARTFFSFLMSCSFVAIQDLFCGILASYLPDVAGELLSQVVVFFILALVIIRFIRKPLLETLEQLQTGWIRLSLIPICLLLSFLNIASYPAPLNERPESIPAAIGLCVAIVLYNGTIYTILKQQSSYFESTRELSSMQLQMTSLKKHMQAIAESEENLRIFQHDLRHLTTALTACIKTHSDDEALAILASMNNTIEKISRPAVCYCEDEVLNAVLSVYGQMAENVGITVSIRVNLPEKLSISVEELSLVFANGIENAINACNQMNSADARRISVVCSRVGSQLFIEITNTYTGEIMFNAETGYPETIVKDHGFGTQSISIFARRYGGLLRYKAEDGMFSMRLILPVCEDKS
ncbi:ATP-binding protein [Eubacterium sp. 1001713B170207_170306_E7]|uniref:sensor histidine kinase n=1 Tax=Eubacterium sp. 1001713B170207_170306_E7 TaxID=2787097 RepID=UPI00189BBA22|nr:ATP-binding protein [Eubacterium sp. 1001713B170207_170306_E7]